MSGQDDDQVFYRRMDEVDVSSDQPNDTELYEGELGSSDTVVIEDFAQSGLRSDETDDPEVAAQEGLPYVPPSDPPIVPDPDDPQGARIAAGFGSTAEDEPYDSSHRSELMSSEDDIVERIREALLADAATTAYADTLAIAARGGTVAIRGVVEDIDDTDNIVDVIGRVSGVEEVIDELDIPGVTD